MTVPLSRRSETEVCPICNDTGQYCANPDEPQGALRYYLLCPHHCASRLWDAECERAHQDSEETT